LKKLFPLCLFLIANLSFSQIKLSGKIVDKTMPVSFAEITLYKDSIPFETTLTDENGDFIMNINQGQYYLECRFFGNILFKKEFLLKQDKDLGIIQVENVDQLSEVIVTSKKRLIERRVDRLIFNVQNSVAVTGGNALDALKITPRIRVQNDQISMIGKGNMVVTLNDRIVRLSGEDLANFLKTFNAEDVKRIEVISNPPAKYSAEGNSGVINIVTKPTRSDSWNIRLRSIYQQATYPTGNYGAGINFRKGKFEITSNKEALVTKSKKDFCISSVSNLAIKSYPKIRGSFVQISSFILCVSRPVEL
jgi:hypothetical protein